MIAVMIAGMVSGLISLFATRALITLFRTRGLGQPILGKEDRGPEHHMPKQGTPTMGGIAIIGAALGGWLAAHVREGLPFSTQALIMWVGILAMAHDGFPRRLHQGPQTPQPGHLLEAEELRHARHEHPDRVVARRRDRHLGVDLAHPRRLPGLGRAVVGVRHLRRTHHLGDHQRGQRHRRARRARRRRRR